MKNCFIVLLLVGINLSVVAAVEKINKDKKYIEAHRISQDIKVDGNLQEAAWKEAALANKFKTYSPTIGQNPVHDTEVKILYDDQSIYIGAYLFDESGDHVLRELSKRDQDGANADVFWITLNPFNDGQNIFRFEISAANVQRDIKISSNSWDVSWNAVWESEVSIVEDGWIVEMRIPYSAIRFSSNDVQNWSVNFWRSIRRYREISTWNPVDRRIGSDALQYGEITNIKGIDAPMRLELYPYISAYIGKNAGDNNIIKNINGGMDLKYGLSESFTIDATLIPDFGQTASDNQVLNLGPYETYYSENREFFKEGTELFTKAGLFYSRRIGAMPDFYYDVEDQLREGERISYNPSENKMINATKLSGRTSSNLGIGVLNAITSNSYAEIVDENGIERKYLTNPFTNYNIFVLDQIIGKSSYLNLTNTNLWQPGANKVADVISTVYKFTDESNRFALWGKLANSMQYDSLSKDLISGQRYHMALGKISGKVQFNYYFDVLTDTYDHNALGYLSSNNRVNQRLSFQYIQYEPSTIFKSWNSYLNVHYNLRYRPTAYKDFYISTGFSGTLNNFLSFGLSSSVFPLPYRDYDITYTENLYLERPEQANLRVWFSSDYRKMLALDANIEAYKGTGEKYSFRLAPRLRVNDKITLMSSFQISEHFGDNGYVTSFSDSIVFGNRDRMTLVNNISSTYVFNNKSALSLSFRHYWSEVDYLDYFLLNKEGKLDAYDGYTSTIDKNYNTVNVDLSYSWNFAPGSFMSVMWKNNIVSDQTVEDNRFRSFNENLKETFTNGANNVISLKITYFIDYQTLKKRI